MKTREATVFVLLLLVLLTPAAAQDIYLGNTASGWKYWVRVGTLKAIGGDQYHKDYKVQLKMQRPYDKSVLTAWHTLYWGGVTTFGVDYEDKIEVFEIADQDKKRIALKLFDTIYGQGNWLCGH